MKIGEKIKKIRKENGWSQEAISSSAGCSQSTIASIEKDNMNPSEKSVRALADALETYYDDLIEGTDWKSDDKKNDRTSYAISISEVKVSIDDKGRWDYQNYYYPIKDGDDKENKFSPISGHALIYQCEDCKRSINRPEQKYCMGCGKNLIPDFQVFPEIKEMMSKYPYMKESKAAEALLELLVDMSAYYENLLNRVKTFQHINTNPPNDAERKSIEKTAKSLGMSDEVNFDSMKKNIVGLLNELSDRNINMVDYDFDYKKTNYEEIIKKLEFNICIADGLARNMYLFIDKNASEGFESIRLELYRKLASAIDDMTLSLSVDLEKNPVLDKLEGIDEVTRGKRIKVKMEALNQLKETLKTIDDVKDGSHEEIDKLINKASTLTDEKISNDLDEEKSRSNEKEDSSSIEDEKSSKPKKKGT